ncbi:MAG TPA: hypothetical protein P5277_04305 [Candidatus Paceibacterota bacterium]|nr:hypothetical protein [Candidatus Paceibacterota bacterium]
MVDWSWESRETKWKKRQKYIERTKGKLEGISYREDLARDLYDQGNYEDSAKVYDEIAEILNKHPSERDQIKHYRELANNVRKKLKESRLESDIEKAMAIVGLGGGLFLLSSNITGNAIRMSQSSGNLIGGIFLIIGIIGCFLWISNKKK